MTIETLKEDYERRIKSINKTLFDNASDMDVETHKRLRAKLSCYRTFLDELSKVESESSAKEVKE